MTKALGFKKQILKRAESSLEDADIEIYTTLKEGRRQLQSILFITGSMGIASALTTIQTTPKSG